MAGFRPRLSINLRGKALPPGAMVRNYTPEELQEIQKQLYEARIGLVKNMATGVSEVDTPGVGRVQFATVEEMALALQQIDSELSNINNLLGYPTQRRRPLHPVAIE